jgi:hypothetical protein
MELFLSSSNYDGQVMMQQTLLFMRLIEATAEQKRKTHFNNAVPDAVSRRQN